MAPFLAVALGLPAWLQGGTASAQPAAPQQGADAEAAPSDSLSPPARVGRVAALRGAVALRQGDGAGGWGAARRNDPLTTASDLITGAGAEVKLEIGPSRLWLGETARLAIIRLDDHRFVGRLSAGAMFLDIRDPDPGETWYIVTARATLRAERTGRFVIEAGDSTGKNPHATRFSGLDAPAEIVSGLRSYRLGVERSAVFVGAQSPYRGAVGDLQVDDFTLTMGAHDPAEYASSPPVFALPPQVARMTGGENLLSVGSWRNSTAFGPLWSPPESSGYTPYTTGTWTYVAPWGWTWVDSTSWGFAPFHYGRWVPVDGSWAWAPTLPNAPLNAPPVYAPALVAFVGQNAGLGLGSGFGFDLGTPSLYPFGSLAWTPLWPGEFYIPPYPVDRTYLRAVNRLAVADPDHPTAPDPAALAQRAALSITALSHAAAAARAASAPARAVAENRAIVDEIHVNAERIMTHIRPGFARAMAARSATPSPGGFAARATGTMPLAATRSHASSHH
ncbi:MAG: DUF6600 domain-containing protein [Acidibrevibacterium sp.]|uniref:DUF6600 domain-containing protein n=1 Tax=Acidibrevibacterium sp. TaxID=2606776 RepID=UPI003CFF5D05